jgi:DNA-binding CsgD family transcriptional regulator
MNLQAFPNQTAPAACHLNQLMHLWQRQPFSNETDLIDFQQLSQTSPDWYRIAEQSPCLTWIIDLRKQGFVFASPNIHLLLGYTPTRWLQQGLPLWGSLIHPEEADQLGKATLGVWKHLLDQSPEQRRSFRFSRDYRIRRSDGQYTRILEQSAVLQMDRRGNITHLISLVSDLSQALLGKPMELELKQSAGGVQSASQAPVCPVLSKREREIVQLLAQGFSSKHIAAQLHIAVNTVNTHRKNILEKTQAGNTGGLIRYAMRVGLI